MSFYAEVLGALGLGEITTMLDYNIINYGGKAVYIDGFSAIAKIEQDQIILQLKKKRIIVEGDLSVQRLEDHSIIIVGSIKRVYEEG